MNPWMLLSGQDVWWVPAAGWDAWARTSDLASLEPNIERIAVSAMTPEHRVRAATHLVNQTLAVEILRAEFPLDFDASSHRHMIVDANRVLGHAALSPLAVALCDQPAMITPHLDAVPVRELFEAARTAALAAPAGSPPSSTAVGDLHCFDMVNDALAGALVSHAARLAPQALLAKLVNQGVLLPDALVLATSLAL